MISLKKIGYYNIFLMLIAVTALILSIISIFRKSSEPFGDTGKCVQNPKKPDGTCKQEGGLGLPCTLPEQDGGADCNYAIGRQCVCK